LTSNEYSNEIKLNEYNNYEVFIINDYNGTNTNEIIISKKEEFILIINHVYKPGYYYGNSNVIMYKNNIMQDVTYDWYKTPFNYELQYISNINNNIYINKSTSYLLNDIDNTKAYVETNLDEYGNNYDFGDKPGYAYFIIDSSFKNKQNYDIYSPENIYSSNDTSIIKGYDNFVNSYIDTRLDFR